MSKLLRRSSASRSGFSLVEILVAAILTVLLAQATAAALRISVQTQNRASTENSFENAIVADLEQIRAISRELCRNPNFDRTATNAPNNLRYGAFGDCAGSVFEDRCTAKTASTGFGALINGQVPAFTSQSVTVNGQTWTISRATTAVQVASRDNSGNISNPGDLDFAAARPTEERYSRLRVAYNLTRGSESITPAFVTEFVPEAVGSCEG